MSQGLLAVVGHVMAKDLDVAGSGVQQPEDQADGSALARSVGSQEPEDVAAAHHQVEVVYGS